MRTTAFCRVLIASLLLTPGLLNAQRQVARTVDHALLLRASGSVIARKETRNNHTCDLPTGPARGNRFTDTEEFRGTATSVTYAQRHGRSIGDVYRELRQQLAEAGVQVIYQCADGKCGRGTGPANWCNPPWRGANGQRHLTGAIINGSSVAIISLHVQAPDDRERAVAHLTVVELDDPSAAGRASGVGKRLRKVVD